MTFSLLSSTMRNIFPDWLHLHLYSHFGHHPLLFFSTFLQSYFSGIITKFNRFLLFFWSSTALIKYWVCHGLFKTFISLLLSAPRSFCYRWEWIFILSFILMSICHFRIHAHLSQRFIVPQVRQCLLSPIHLPANHCVYTYWIRLSHRRHFSNKFGYFFIFRFYLIILILCWQWRCFLTVVFWTVVIVIIVLCLIL